MNNKLKKISLPDQVCTAIKANVINKIWPVGYKLSSEKELAEKFGVNRLTIRLALQKLNILGILQTKVGDGTYVTDFDLACYMSEVSELYVSEDMLFNVYDFRYLVEKESVRLASIYRTDNDIEELKLRFDAFKRAAKKLSFSDENSWNEYAEADYNFHYKTVQISKNALYELAYLAVKEPLIRYFKVILFKYIKDDEKEGLSMQASIDSKLHDHSQILEAIITQDYELAELGYKGMVPYEKTMINKQIS